MGRLKNDVIVAAQEGALAGASTTVNIVAVLAAVALLAVVSRRTGAACNVSLDLRHIARGGR